MKLAYQKNTLTAIVLAIAATVAAGQGTQLSPPAQRISDRAIDADHRQYEAMQGRIRAINDRGRPLRDYHLSKAQCWLDVSFHEYTRNDRSAFPQEALTEAEKLIAGMEKGAGPLPSDTPLVNGAARLRPDLWQRAGALQAHAGWVCAQQRTACAEVELVHAGNEHNQQQWRHARPYVQIAEDLLAQAQQAAETCTPPAPAAAPAAPAPPVVIAAPAPVAPPAPPAVQTLQLGAEVVFNFDRHDIGNARPYARVRLEQLAQRIQREKLVVQAIRLVGHADRLNGTGQDDYNQRLSEQRVATVKAELVRLGIDARLIDTEARGDRQQIEGCAQRFTRPSELQECLLPNRRVDVIVEARRP